MAGMREAIPARSTPSAVPIPQGSCWMPVGCTRPMTTRGIQPPQPTLRYPVASLVSALLPLTQVHRTLASSLGLPGQRSSSGSTAGGGVQLEIPCAGLHCQSSL